MQEDEQLIHKRQTADINQSGDDHSKTEQKSKRKKWIIIGLIIAALIILIIVLAVTLSKKNNNPEPTPVPSGYNQYSLSSSTNNVNLITGYLGFADSAVQNNLQSLISASDVSVDTKNIPKGLNNNIIKNVSFMFGMTSYKTAYLKLTDANHQRYEVPQSILPSPSIDYTMRLEQIGFTLNSNPFSFSFKDTSDSNNVFIDTKDQTLFMADKYIQLDMKLGSQRIYGLGERVHEFNVGEGAWTMWAKGQDNYDDGKGGQNAYGVHPFALIQSKSATKFFGVFFKNSNAQTPIIKHNSDGTSTLSYITLGGALEIYFFVYGTAKEIIQQYHLVIGYPTLPPYWALGWHQSSWKYVNQSMVEDVIANYSKHDFPLETIWLDIPYMDGYADFSVDQKNFGGLKTMTNDLHSRNQHLILILDGGISAEDPNNKYFKAAKDASALIHSTVFNDTLYQEVWPKHTVFLDWFHSEAPKIWAQGLEDLFQQVPYDGIWIDMNEATCFQAGELNLTKTQNTKKVQQQLDQLKRRLEQTLRDDKGWYQSYTNQDSNNTYELPFVPGYFSDDGQFYRFDNFSISLNATHYGNLTEYDVHNLFGLMMSRATYNYLTNNTEGFPFDPTLNPNYDKRAFVLSRSTFPSSGKYASHWLGDNWRQWNYLNYSIAGTMNMNMFGIPLVGADICGFLGNETDDEMCARWIQLATFYPFARMHQNQTWLEHENPRSEPYFMSEQWQNIARDAIYDRYQYLRQMYTCLFEVSQWGGSCFDPLLYYYPEDPNVFDQIEHTFMINGAMKVSPILNPYNQTMYYPQFKSYFPAGYWVDLADYSVINSTGDWQNLNATNTVKVHLRQGSIIAKQENPTHQYNSTTDFINNVPITLIANRDSNGQAQGDLFLDGGISISEITNNQYELIRFNLQQNTIMRANVGGTEGARKQPFYKFVITNAKDLLGTNFACVLGNDLSTSQLHITPNATAQTITLTSTTTILMSDIRQIMFGGPKDINLCDSQAMQYQIKDGQQLDLSKSNASVILTYSKGILPDLNLTLNLQTYPHTIVNVKWTFVDEYTYRRPYEVPNDIVGGIAVNASAGKLSDYVSFTANPFNLTISTGTNKVIDITGQLLDNYLNIIQTQLHTMSGNDFKGIFGLGERVGGNLFYPDGVYSMWARDVPSPVENGKAPGNNLYGTHPFYQFQVNTGIWTGVFTKLAAAQDWWIKNNKDAGQININTIATGGIADIFVIIGDSPKSVTQGYWQLIGTPVFTPQFALGWNQCKWGYANTSMLREVVDQYAAHNIPLDTQWSDIDYLDSYRDFTYDTLNFKDLPDFINELHGKGMHYVPIIDAGIAKKDYFAYNQGHDKDVFIKIKDNQELIGKVWPGDAVFPDFFNAKTSGWWGDQLTTMNKSIVFDGLWQDMNEASDFCGGLCYNTQKPDKQLKYQFKYLPTGRDLEGQSMPLDAYQANNYTQLDTHSFYGTQQVKASHEWFQANNRRTFIIERSSFAGMGKYGSRWLGDNRSTVQYMGYSVLGVMMMNMFGIPLVGADICGFNDNTNPELCARWTALGAFYPFARNHNNWGQTPQEPYVFNTTIYEGSTTYTDIMTRSIRIRYHMIRYYYTQLYLLSDANMTQYNEGTLLFQPMFFEYPNDAQVYSDVLNNIMLGSALKLSILADTVGVDSHTFYFPAGTWCNVFNSSEACFTSTTGISTILRTKAYDFYVHLREGHIIPMQDATTLNVNTTAQLQDQPVDFHVLPSLNTQTTTWSANGLYYNDDGIILNFTNNSNSYKIMIDGKQGDTFFKLSVNTITVAGQIAQGLTCTAVNRNDFLGRIEIYNALALKINVSYKVTLTYTNGNQKNVGAATYDAASQRLIFISQQGLPICLSSISTLQFDKI